MKIPFLKIHNKIAIQSHHEHPSPEKKKYKLKLLVNKIFITNGLSGNRVANVSCASSKYRHRLMIIGTASVLIIACSIIVCFQMPRPIAATISEDSEIPQPANIADEPVVWKDRAMERMVRMALCVDTDHPITGKDLAGITSLKIVGKTHASANGVLDALNSVEGYTIHGVTYTERGDIKTLDDLVHFTSLNKLVIGYNNVSDISAVIFLTQLETLGLYCNDISDITPLSGLQKLHYLYVYNNNIADISPLQNLTGLKMLFIQNNQITDITPVSQLSQITTLHISANKVSNIDAVSNLKSMCSFYASDNNITDISGLKALEKLTDLSLAGNPITDYTPVNHVPHIIK